MDKWIEEARYYDGNRKTEKFKNVRVKGDKKERSLEIRSISYSRLDKGEGDG